MKHFITFEGIDGSGKSTISEILYKKLKKDGYKVILTYEPTDSWIGKKVQKYIKSKTDPYITSLTFIADRIQHGKKIENWINKDFIVLCDRYAESTYAYQGAQLNNEIVDPIKFLKELTESRIPIPDRTYLFLIDPEESIKRIKKRDNLIPFEELLFLKKVHNNYLKLSKENRFLIIDATKTIESIVKFCYEDILKK
jgi:dTMP kinase